MAVGHPFATVLPHSILPPPLSFPLLFPPEHDPRLSLCARFSFQQLQQATDGWAESNLLGSGAFGTVYKGRDPSNPDVMWAVKRAKLQSSSFRKEVSGGMQP